MAPVALRPEALPPARGVSLLDMRGNPLEPAVAANELALNAWLAKELARTRDEGCTWHGLRRGCATYMSHLGVPLHDIQEWGRWDSPSVAKSYIFPWRE